jgi:hypothetical protein
MPTISRVRAGWTGWNGAPAVSTFYTAAPPTGAQLTAIRTLFFALQGYIPSGIAIQVENAGQQIDTATGKAVDVWTGAAQTVVTGTATGAYHAAGGFYVRWNTGVFNSGRLLRGKTYFVPISSAQYQNDGTIDNATIGTIQTAVNAFIASMSGGLAVYSRRYAMSTTATSGTAIDKAVVLTSRRP